MTKGEIQLLKGPCLTLDGENSEGAEQKIEAVVETRIKEHEIIVFSKSYCPHCKKVKKLFEDNGIGYAVVELDQHRDGANIQQHLRNVTKQGTVPNVFVNGNHVGGASDTVAKWNSGELQRLIETN
mmetsp:Transcript_3548/g.7314  ORF Transcript_3548/g.7314 Transcript_3548/m.7314 type:complete len:126 (-) Transcript_3548:683-1060(-)